MSVKDSSDEGTKDKAMSEGSDNADNQPSSGTQEYVSVAEFAKLQSTIESLRRSVQSDKDKGVKKVAERVEALEGDLRTVLKSAMKEGKTIDDVLASIDEKEEQETRQTILEMAQAFKTGAFPKPPQGSGEASGADVSSVVAKLELDQSDLRVKDFMSKTFASNEDALIEGARVLKQILRTQPTDVDQPTDVAKVQRSAPEQVRLMQEYTEGSKGLMGQALLNHKMRMRKKGLVIS